MKKNLNQTFGRRMLSLVMVLLMAFPWVSAPAMAASDWSELEISVSWQDGSGNTRSASADPLEWNQAGNTFWVQVENDAPLDGLTLSISHPSHPDYTFAPGNGTVLEDVHNAQGLESNAVYITAFNGDKQADSYVLYVSTNVVPPEPVATEKPPAQKEINVIYQGTDGTDLGGTKFTAIEGEENRVQAPAEIDGYTLTGESEYYITVDSDGNADPSSVTFNYNPPATPEPTEEPTPKPPAQTEIDVYYQGTDDKDLGGTKFTAIEGEENRVQAPDEIDGYTLTGDSEYYITVDSDGNADPSSVTFKYNPPATPEPTEEPTPKPPAQIEIDVYYQGTDDKDLGGTKFTAVEGEENRVQAPDEIEGYTLTGESEYYITVDSDGNADPSSVTFKYNPPVTPEPTEKPTPKPAAQKEINVIYQGTDGKDLGGTKFTAIQGEENRVQAPAQIEGYTLTGESEYYITVDSDGNADPSSVTFNYNPPAEAAKFPVQIEYVKDGQVFHTDSKDITAGKTASVPVDNNQTPAGYKLDGPSSVDVSMDAKGNPTPNKVTFNFVPVTVEPPAKYPVQIEYVKDGQVFHTDSKDITAGESAPVPVDDKQTPAGYKLDGPSSVDVSMDAKGNPTPNKVTFNYVPVTVEPPAKYPVQIEYVKDGQVFHTDSQDITAGESASVPVDNTQTPAGYKLDGPSSVNVSMDANGNPTPNKVTFTYVQVMKTITVYYRNESNNDIATPQQKALGVGTNQITPEPADLQANYRIKGDTVKTVTVNQDGTSDADSVTFVYEYVAPVVETPVPVGSAIDRWGVTNANVNFRSSPAIASDNGIKKLSQGAHVWMYESLYNDANEVWTHVMVDGQDGYIMTEYIDMMTQAQSDTYQDTLNTPMPTRSPAPNATPTPVPGQYSGYALTTKKVALRIDTSNTDQSILATLPMDTLVSVVNQVYQGTVPWSLVETLDGLTGYVPDDSLRRINQQEAKYYIDQYNAAHPTAAPVTPTPSPTPVRQSGYAATLGDNVPMRGQANPNSMLVNMLAKNTVVYVSGQEYLDGTAWHIVQFSGQWGYIRADQLRWLSKKETTDYLNSLHTPTPTPANTLPPLDENSASSYGYVTKSSVNFRSAPGGTKIATLNQYAFALVLGSTQVNGTTWYKVNQAGREGYISGDFFHVLSLAELEEFLQSPEYTQGTTGNTGNNNNNSGNDNNDPPTSPEDLNVGTWTNPNTGLNATYEPFDPYATPEPLPTPTPSPTPEPLATFEPLPTEPPVETQSDSPSFVWLGLGVALLGGFGGLYAYALHKSNQRKAAARAAQRRAAMQQNPQSGARPYARATNAPMVPPASGTQVKPAAPPTGAPRPQTTGSTASSSPYSQRPASTQPSGMNQRPPVTRPGQPGTTPAQRPGQQPGAFARPTASTQPEAQATASYRTEAQGNAAASDGQAAQHSGASASTSRQPRAARHTGNPTDQNTPTDTNENL